MLKNIIHNVGSKLKHWLVQCVRWVVSRPYKRMGISMANRIGEFLHYLLFEWLLPKRLRGITKEEIFTIIFKADTPAGKKFDIWLLVLIFLNMLLLMVESFPVVQEIKWLSLSFHILEWMFTIVFTFEYYLRVYCLTKPWKYLLSLWGIIDFLSIFPAYLSLLFPGAQTFTVFRLLRMLRIFRIFNMRGFMKESRFLLNALRRSAMKILIFMLFVYITAVILGSIMYAVECNKNAEVFNSIPSGVYWAVVTLTTVGYGDMTPITPTGRFISIVVMILGYSIIAVPTGIVAGETIAEHKNESEREEEDDLQKGEDGDESFL